MASEARNGYTDGESNKASVTEINPYRKWLERRPDPSSISAETMQLVEEIAWKEVLCKIHPTLDEDEKRADITLFLQKLIIHSFSEVEVFPYGSVPLKTYLGDGDIDLTVICSPDINQDALAENIYALLKNEESNIYAEYAVKGTKLIRAEVKLVTCKVNKVSVDISFNQLGGLSALCFLEQIDRRVNNNHLFKQSILLIKAWCHYEAHILGSFHNLLATYTLEVLILCIFQLFSSSLHGPLAVLYRFLDYYGKFDWKNYAISLDGPVRRSSLPDVVVADLGNGGAELLLSREDRRSYMDMFGSSSYSEPDRRKFAVDDFNIIDPLKENNNLGRKVYKANFNRMQSAFKYGARILGKILLLPRESIPGEIKKFFECTLTKYGRSTGAKVESLPPLWPSEEDVDLKSIDGDHFDDLTLDFEGARLARDASDPLAARSLNEYMGVEAIENSELLDLAGDYASLTRNFTHGRCTIGFCATRPALRYLPIPTIAHEQIMWNGTWDMHAYGADGQFVYTENSNQWGMGPYIPDMFSASGTQEYFYPPLVNPMQEPSGEVQIRDGNAAVEAVRIEETPPINLNSEHDFPPLD